MSRHYQGFQRYLPNRMLKLSSPNISNAEIERVSKVLYSGNLVQGDEVRELESFIQTYCSSKYTVAVSSGTAALYISLKSLGIGAGDAVIVPGFSFPATANVVEEVGAEIIFADVEFKTAGVSASTLALAYDNYSGENKIKAIIPVHEFGYPVDMDLIMRFAEQRNIDVIEDAACAFGVTHNGRHVSTYGNVGCFSFHPRKMLTSGEGGAVVTQDRAIYELAMELRNHGIKVSAGGANFVRSALNFRMTDIHAAIANEQANKIEDIIATELREISYIEVDTRPAGGVWQTYFARIVEDSVDRDDLIRFLRSHKIEANIGAHCLPALPSFVNYAHYLSQTPVSKVLHERGIALPCSELYSDQQIKYVCQKLREYEC